MYINFNKIEGKKEEEIRNYNNYEYNYNSKYYEDILRSRRKVLKKNFLHYVHVKIIRTFRKKLHNTFKLIKCNINVVR